MSTFSLPPHFLTCVGLHDRGYYEVGGWLLARQEAPHQVIIATGPGLNSDRDRYSIAIERKGVDYAAALNGFVLVGDWHSHPQGQYALKYSPADLEAWRHQLDFSKTLQVIDRWFGVVVVREGRRTEGIKAWEVRRDGRCEPVPLPPLTDETRKRAELLSFGIERGPLVQPPTTWQPALVKRELARIDLELELEDRMRLNDLNERLKRLGISGELSPIARTPQHAHDDEVTHGGLLRRPNIGQVLGVR